MQTIEQRTAHVNVRTPSLALADGSRSTGSSPSKLSDESCSGKEHPPHVAESEQERVQERSILGNSEHHRHNGGKARSSRNASAVENGSLVEKSEGAAKEAFWSEDLATNELATSNDTPSTQTVTVRRSPLTREERNKVLDSAPKMAYNERGTHELIQLLRRRDDFSQELIDVLAQHLPQLTSPSNLFGMSVLKEMYAVGLGTSAVYLTYAPTCQQLSTSRVGAEILLDMVEKGEMSVDDLTRFNNIEWMCASEFAHKIILAMIERATTIPSHVTKVIHDHIVHLSTVKPGVAVIQALFEHSPDEEDFLIEFVMSQFMRLSVMDGAHRIVLNCIETMPKQKWEPRFVKILLATPGAGAGASNLILLASHTTGAKVALCAVTHASCHFRMQFVSHIRTFGFFLAGVAASKEICAWANRNQDFTETMIGYDKGTDLAIPIPMDVVIPTAALRKWQREKGLLAKLSSICINHQNNRCRAGPRCNMIHTKVPLDDLRTKTNVCCAEHASLSAPSSKKQQNVSPQKAVDGSRGVDELLVATGKFELAKVPLGSCTESAFLGKYLQKGVAAPPVPYTKLCRQHYKGACGKPEKCKFLHVCRRIFVALTETRPLSPLSPRESPQASPQVRPVAATEPVTPLPLAQQPARVPTAATAQSTAAESPKSPKTQCVNPPKYTSASRQAAIRRNASLAAENPPSPSPAPWSAMPPPLPSTASPNPQAFVAPPSPPPPPPPQFSASMTRSSQSARHGYPLMARPSPSNQPPPGYGVPYHGGFYNPGPPPPAHAPQQPPSTTESQTSQSSITPGHSHNSLSRPPPVPCKYHKLGCCTKGRDCNFLHLPPPPSFKDHHQ